MTYSRFDCCNWINPHLILLFRSQLISGAPTVTISKDNVPEIKESGNFLLFYYLALCVYGEK